MIKNVNKYQYVQQETYKELLELKHIRLKASLVNVIVLALGVLVTTMLFYYGFDRQLSLVISFMFVTILAINISLYSYNHDLYNNLKISMYVNVLGLYGIAVTLVLLFKTPSIFTSLFLVYAITAIYQDYKVMLLSNSSLFIFGGLIAFFHPSVFLIPGINQMHNLYIIIYLLLFVLLLTLSSYILIKRKAFFYNQLSSIKEAEVRNLDLLSKIEFIKTKEIFNDEHYYKSLNEFSKILSKKIGIENIFSRKIDLLRDLKKYSLVELLERYPEYNENQIKQLSLLELSINKKMRNIALKASQSDEIIVNKKEIFSEVLYKSFAHNQDSRYIKTISFAVFYCLLKLDKPYFAGLEEHELKDILTNSDYFYKIDKDIFEIYYDNFEVFDTIVKDVLKGVYYNEKNPK